MEEDLLIDEIVQYGLNDPELQNEALLISERIKNKDKPTQVKVWCCYGDDIIRKFHKDRIITLSREDKNLIKKRLVEELM